MPANILMTVVAVVAAGALGLALYFWRRSSNLYALLMEGANRFEELRLRCQKLEQSLLKGEERVRQQKDSQLSLEKALHEAREQSASLVQRVEAKDHELQYVTQKLELQKGHLEKQLAKLGQELEASHSEKEGILGSTQAQMASLEASFEQRLRREQDQARRRLDTLKEEAFNREKALQQRLSELEKEHGGLQKKVKEADPIEMRKLRRRISQYDRLYTGMKGLREMTEERNRNYEVALTKLASWVLRSTGKASVNQAFGPLVGSALQAIGAQLIDDHELDLPSREAKVHTIPGSATLDKSKAVLDRSTDTEETALDEELANEEQLLQANFSAQSEAALKKVKGLSFPESAVMSGQDS